ncbi:pseudouridine synthase [Fundicoccus culcitae]|uniref:Pseudouridine synthase n=1 Tax=Fundicoccus culcitae TaxID=2969821 RepID=A0ABY5P836_9LACT|nr:pseudouridine synthase [Fundicoccus culcitae]UUX34545.1 rRNA pseudouridine synthase [Fundicoccus culcitae]
MERLQKVLAHAGVASRRKSEDLILAGRVSVNGIKITELGTKVNANDLIEVDGVPIYKEEPKYILLYKPKNVISAVSDDKGREVVTDYIHLVNERIYPIGRLDYDTTGLLLLTNDGEFANLLMHPKYQIDKVYVAKVEGIPTMESIKKLTQGVVIDGKQTTPARVSILQQNKNQNTSVIELTIHEGWNHQVKKMFEAIGHPVTKLKREKFGFLDLGKMNPGDWRELTAFEVNKLTQMAKNV